MRWLFELQTRLCLFLSGHSEQLSRGHSHCTIRTGIAAGPGDRQLFKPFEVLSVPAGLYVSGLQCGRSYVEPPYSMVWFGRAFAFLGAVPCLCCFLVGTHIHTSQSVHIHFITRCYTEKGTKA